MIPGSMATCVVYPRVEQLLVAQDLVGICDGVCASRDDNAPPGPSLRVETVGFIGDYGAVAGSQGSGDRGGQPGADDYPAFVHQMINRADRWKCLESKYDPPIADAGQQPHCLSVV